MSSPSSTVPQCARTTSVVGSSEHTSWDRLAQLERPLKLWIIRVTLCLPEAPEVDSTVLQRRDAGVQNEQASESGAPGRADQEKH
eukprot:4283931-Amphidinium_carterae.1